MKNLWSDEAADRLLSAYPEIDEDLALRTYASRLIGSEPELVLHGGGNTSVKTSLRNRLGDTTEVLRIKASGHDLGTIEPQGHVAVDLGYLRRLLELEGLSDEDMVDEIRTHLFDHEAPTPSIETLVHAAIAAKFVDHSHADSVLALGNRPNGEEKLREALGNEVTVLPYVAPGFELARAVATALRENPRTRAMVWHKHGLVTWGETARKSYDRMIEIVIRAEEYLAAEATSPSSQTTTSRTTREQVEGRLSLVAPILRGLLSHRTNDPDRPYRPVVLRPVVEPFVLDFLDSPKARQLSESAPLTADHLIRTKPLPLWIDVDFDNPENLRTRIKEGIDGYVHTYRAYLDRHADRMPTGVEPFDPLPRVVLIPGLGAICAGRNAKSADVARDITAQTLAVKARLGAIGVSYEGLAEEHLFDMEYRSLQHAKLSRHAEPALEGRVALVTGAAGAIGSAICVRLLEEGAHVAATDLSGDPLDSLVAGLEDQHRGRILGIDLDVTQENSVADGFARAAREWGGVDLVVINAGLAQVAALAELSVTDFQRLQRVNTDGTMLLLAESSRHLKHQGLGGDIVLVSTKNVAAPGPGFGAYSATKAAAHQLARIASMELASSDIRVNMVAPDAIFRHGDRESGLWQEVGPDRMKARGLDAEGLEEYYRKRNLLGAKITADHVAEGVLFFVTRRTPTTGVTLPIDGGLPEATPR